MSDKHVLSFFAICEFFAKNKKQLQKGENAYRSGHVRSVMYDSMVQDPFIKGVVSASMKTWNYNVTINLDQKMKIAGMTCTCPRGQDVCHHVAAFALHCHYNISVTDKTCVWNDHKSKEEEVADISILYPTSIYRGTKRRCTEGEVATFREKLSKCHAVGFSWLLRPETSVPVESILDISKVVFSTEYTQAPDKEEFI